MSIPFNPKLESLPTPLQRLWPELAEVPAEFILYATYEDMKSIREHFDDDDLRAALENAPPGIIDARSWAYWHLKLDRYPAPEMPTRGFNGWTQP